MPSLRKYSVPSILAVGLAALVLSACGGSDDSEITSLAGFAPTETPVFIEGAVQPDSDVAANVDSITDKLAGVNLGDLIKDGISSSSEADIDFETDVKPWLGANAAMFAELDMNQDDSTAEKLTELGEPGSLSYPGGSESFGLVVETSDTDAAQAFIDKRAADDSATTDGEYEGFSYKVEGDGGSAVGIVNDHLVVGSTEETFKASIDATKGDSLADSDGFSDLTDKVSDGALVSMVVSNAPYFDALKAQGVDLSGLSSSLGVNLDGRSVLSLVPNENEISLQGFTESGSDMVSGDPSPVIETFPADSLFATGSGDVGANVTRVIETLNKEGIPGLIEPGQVDKFMNQASGQIDIKGIVESLETVAFFVSGENQNSLGGALVATSSDVKPIEDSLRGISSLIAIADDADVKPLGGGATGFRVRTKDLPGRPVVIGVKDDRMVIGIGMKAAMAALNGSGQTLADSDAYKAAVESIPADGIDMFANPAAIANLITNSTQGDPNAKQIADVISKFEYMAAGSGDSDDTFELNLGLEQ